MDKKPIIILSGPTASGKSALALDIAKHIGAVIINADSKQVYKEIPIITAQPSEEERAQVKHKLYGTKSVKEDYTVANWIKDVCPIIDEIRDNDKLPLLVGGTGMYIKYLIEPIAKIPEISFENKQYVRNKLAEIGNEPFFSELVQMDPLVKGRLNVGDSQRIMRAYEVFKQCGKSIFTIQAESVVSSSYKKSEIEGFFLSPGREKVYDNCNKRFDIMLKEGVLSEAKLIQNVNLDESLPAAKAHGLPELRQYLRKEITLEEAVRIAKKNTRNYIKRQFTWFRGQMSDFTELAPENAKEALLQKIALAN